MGFARKDADSSVKKTKALPDAGGGSVTSDLIDLGLGAFGDHLGDCELLITAPALDATQLPDSETMTFDVVHGASSVPGSASTLYGSVLTQTGDDSLPGSAADTVRVRLPVDVARYVGVKATSSSGGGDASGDDLTSQLVF